MVADESREPIAEIVDGCSAERIAAVLSQSGAVSVEELARALSVTTESVVAALETLVRQKKVEVLRPISRRLCSGRMTDPELEYCRWIRETDQDHVWQSRLVQKAKAPIAVFERRLALLV